ncbi:MAG: SPOR domain-containing protein, partial [Pseudomonadota bacterium]
PEATAKTPRRYGVHVGSYSTKESAERGWKVLGKTSKPLEKVGTHTVLPFNFGAPKGILYRLIAGPLDSKSDAKELCAEIKVEGAYCRVIPVDS